MIKAEITCNLQGLPIGFTVFNHGESRVCAGVSVLVINTINSIEVLTSLSSDSFSYKYEPGGGYIDFCLKCSRGKEEGLLLDAMLLGLRSIEQQHPAEVEIIMKESV